METQQSKRINYAYSMSVNEFEDIITTSRSWSEIARKCGYHNISNFKTIKKRASELLLNVDHINGNAPDLLRARNARTNEELFVENGLCDDRKTLKKRLIQDYGYEHKCNKCGLTEWRGKPIPIELEHKNGVNNDNRIENLEFLCCNCHAQTDTYRGKNIQKYADAKHEIKIKKIFKCILCDAHVSKSAVCCKTCSGKAMRKVKNRPSYDQLLEDKKTMTWFAVGKKYGVAETIVHHWMTSYEKTHESPQ